MPSIGANIDAVRCCGLLEATNCSYENAVVFDIYPAFLVVWFMIILAVILVVIGVAVMLSGFKDLFR